MKIKETARQAIMAKQYKNPIRTPKNWRWETLTEMKARGGFFRIKVAK